MPYRFFQTKKDFSKIPTELNSMYIYKELVKSENIFFGRPERIIRKRRNFRAGIKNKEGVCLQDFTGLTGE